MADYTTEIAELEELITGAAESVSVDGTSNKWSLADARKRLSELRLLDDDSIAAGRVRPRVSTLNLGGAW